MTSSKLGILGITIQRIEEEEVLSPNHGPQDTWYLQSVWRGGRKSHVVMELHGNMRDTKHQEICVNTDKIK